MTKQIKELQEENLRLKVEGQQRESQVAKDAFKEKAEEIKRLEQKLHEKSRKVDEQNNALFILEEKLAKETSLL